jgi:hypothetical protein
LPQCLWKNGNGDPNPGVAQVEKKVLAIDIVDVAVVGVGPAGGPGLRNFKIVATVSEMRTAAHDLDMADCEVVVPAKVGAEVFVGNAASFLVVPFFLADFFVFVISMLVLGDRGNHPREKDACANCSNGCEFLHV